MEFKASPNGKDGIEEPSNPLLVLAACIRLTSVFLTVTERVSGYVQEADP